MKLAKDMDVKTLTIKNDSQLIISQVNGTYKMKVPYLAKYLEKVKCLLGNFDHFELVKIPWSKNDHTIKLAKLVGMKTPNENQSIIQLVMLLPLIEKNESTFVDGKES